MKNKKRRNFWVHPILFGFYPILMLYYLNRNEIVLSAIQQAVLTSFLVAVVVIAICLLVFRSWQKAAISSSLTLLLFYFYGHVFDALKNVALFGEPVARHRYLIALWILVFVVGQALLAKSKNTDGLNRFLNSVSLFLMAFLLTQVSIYAVQAAVVSKSALDESITEHETLSVDVTERDVYYILVDAYSRQDLLQKEFGVDTSEFLAELSNLGFYIPMCAQSNYDTTLLSMTATLNMNYLDALSLDYRSDRLEFQPYIQKNLVIQKFKELGYSTATFKSLYPILDIKDSKYYFDYFSDTSTLDNQATLNFQYLFLRTTMFRLVIHSIETNEDLVIPPFLDRWLPTNNSLNSRDYRQYQQNMYALDSLEKMADLPEKTFVYAHLYTTHQPFVFYPDGRFHPFLVQGHSAYRDQVLFLNQRLLGILKTILAKSDPAPIIVIQSDHSYLESADRVKILNAYYLPDGGDRNLYATVTPVNTFRLIFNTYFDADYSMLPDISRYIDSERVQHEVPSTCVNTKP